MGWRAAHPAARWERVDRSPMAAADRTGADRLERARDQNGGSSPKDVVPPVAHGSSEEPPAGAL